MTRDKRGYESTLVMHAYRANNGQRGRVLYLFRSPSHLQIGRHALDPEVMEALEHTHPDLNFDWAALQRDPALRSNNHDEELRPVPRRQQNQRPQGQAAPVTPTVVIVEDHSLLGKTLGAEQARRLRAQFAELLQRIARRARTPDDRDRLTEQAGRLNPDGWADEAAIQAAVVTVEVEWQAISVQLPRRRRGRRGGRHASEARAKAESVGLPETPATLVSSPEADDGSGIIEESLEESGDGDGAETDSVDREIGARDDRGDDDRLGTDTEARTDSDAAASEPSGPAGDGVPGDGE